MLLHSQVIIILQQHDIPLLFFPTHTRFWYLPQTSLQLTLLISQNYIIFLHSFLLWLCLAGQAPSNLTLPIMESFDYHKNHSHHSLSIHSAAILPELRLPNFPNELTLDNPLKLLLPLSFMFLGFLDLLSLELLISTLSWSASSRVSIFTAASLDMALRQNGQTGGVRQAVAGLGLLWQQRASVHCAHIWWPQFWTSIVHTCSKQMQHNADSLTCIIVDRIPQWV